MADAATVPAIAAFTVKERAFIEAIVINGGNGTQAAKDAGFAAASAHVRAVRLLRRANIAAEIARRTAEVQAVVAVETGLTVARLVEELGHIALFDPGEMFDAAGVMLPLHEMPPHVRRCLKSCEVDEKYAWSDEDAGMVITNRTFAPRFMDKTRAIELVGRQLGAFRQNVAVDAHHTFDVDPGTLSDSELKIFISLAEKSLTPPKKRGTR